MSAMDCGASKMPNNACFPARIQTHIKNQDSNSSALSHDAMAMGEPIPSPRRWSPTYQPRRRSRQFPSLSFVPSPTLPRPDAPEISPSLPRRPADRGPACISPFRSVRKMKEPFQLMLPSSPASCDGAATFAPRTPKHQSKPPAEHSLRTWRSDQNLTSASMAALGLLPSPPMSESRPASTGPEATHFKIGGEDSKKDNVLAPEEGLGKTQPEAPEQVQEPGNEISLEEQINYKAYRPTEWPVQPPGPRMTDVANVHEAHSNLIRQCESREPDPAPPDDTRKSSPVTSPESFQSANDGRPGSSPRPQRPRTATVSSEASWIPSNFSYCETWLQGVPLDSVQDKQENPKSANRRKFQIVEKDPPMPKVDFIPGGKALEEPVVSG